MPPNSLSTITTVYVGTTNPAKLKAVEQVLAELTSAQIIVQGFSVPSEVSDQPQTDRETKIGSANRAKNVFKHVRSQKLLNKTGNTLCIGLEGGVFTQGKSLWCTVWVTLLDPADAKNLIQVNGLRFKLPSEIANPMKTGAEMGHVVGNMAHNPNLKREGGMIGLITNGTVTRTSEYANLVRLAFALWLGKDWTTQLTA